MTGRRVVPFAFASLALILVAGLLSSRAVAQDEIENAKFQAVGAINSSAVYIRSGPSENDYATMKLDKGAQVTVVGERFSWLKILPPEGSFCYVSKAYVNRAGNGSIGIVTGKVFLRIGSALNPLKTKTATTLDPNQRLEIIGEQDEYFKVKPTDDVYLYVNKQFVDFVKLTGETPTKTETPSKPVAQEDTPQKTQIQWKDAPKDSAAGQTSTEISLAPTTAPATQPDAVASSDAPSTQPSAADVAAEFDRAEQTYADISQKPLDEQPVEELLEKYKTLAASDVLPESIRRICDYKVIILQNRADLKGKLVEAKKVQDDMKQKNMALKAEQGELEQRIKATDIQFYTAVGTLRTSSLQQGQQTLYRLTDPANGRTVIYIRSDDPKLGQFIGQFIGVKGDVVNDSQQNLRYITMSNFESVNPAKVGQSIAAQIAPPSLLPDGVTASISNP